MLPPLEVAAKSNAFGTSNKINKSNTTRILFIGKIILLKQLHVSAFIFLGRCQVVSILYQGNCTM
jgi:hypothetical protein